MTCVIAAAGRGSRSGMKLPKTLCEVGGIPIIVRLLRSVRHHDPQPVVIVSPDGRASIETAIRRHGYGARFVVQSTPSGMGDAVLRVADAGVESGEILLIWGDLPFVQPATIDALGEHHRRDGNVFSFATRHAAPCYTWVIRDADSHVQGVLESREQPAGAAAGVSSGERDTGMFLFDAGIVLPALRERGAGATGRVTGEHGFLYVIARLVEAGHRVEGYPIATEMDVLGFNTPEDLAKINRFAG